VRHVYVLNATDKSDITKCHLTAGRTCTQSVEHALHSYVINTENQNTRSVILKPTGRLHKAYKHTRKTD